MLDLGEKIWNLVRLFNLREGFERRHDTLPKRFLEEPLPSGPSQGHRITPNDLEKMLDDYYMIRGWDTEGKPTPETLKRLDLGRFV